MNKIRHFFLHNTELLLYVACWLFHALFAPLSKSYGFDLLAAYNVTVSFVYATFILLFNGLHNSNVFFLFYYLETLVYSVLLTVSTGADFGSTILTVGSIPLLFLTTLSAKKSRRFYIVLVALACCASVFTLWWTYARTGLLALDFVEAITDYRKLYLLHIAFITLIISVFLFYYSTLTQFQISRSQKKARMQAEELEYKANHDQLTGLMNRRKINVFLKQAQAQKEQEHAEYALTIFDIDGFKKINDTYGHDAGDFILRQMSSTVAKLLTEKQYFARWGGEEFVILFTEYSDAIVGHLDEIRRAVEKQVFHWQYTDIHITLTFGLANSKECADLEKMIIEADDRLMYGKQHGKNQVVHAGSKSE